jgi:tryptophan 7-halogenase
MPIECIVIAGGGVAAWMAAAALARKTRCAIVLVQTEGIDDSLGLPLKVEATLPSASLFHEAIGIDEDLLLSRARGSFTLGRALSNWTAAQTPSFHPYGEIGASLGPVAFHQLVARTRAAGESVNLANYSVAALCAQSGRFARPPSNCRSVLSTMEYGLHLECEGYRAALMADAIGNGVVVIDGSIATVKLSADALIASVRLNSGEEINGDLFLDCSGQTRTLIKRMPGNAFDDWSVWLPCDRAVAGLVRDDASPLPYTHVVAHQSGWQSFTAARGAAGEAFVYQSSFGGTQADDTTYSFTSGRMATPWTGNCIAIGGAAAIIDPLASTQMHMAGTAILRLLKLFPHDRACRTEAAEYNRQTLEQQENARDFAITHYALNGRNSEPFWDMCRPSEVPERLAHKIALYSAVGRLALHDEESFEAYDWLALFDGMSVYPKRYDAMADALELSRINDFMQQVRGAMLKAVASVPPHADYLEKLSPEPDLPESILRVHQ